MNLLHDITAGKDAPHIINVVIEIPKGSKNKYEMDKETGLIMLDRALHTAQDYPFDYGFMPQSHWEDGDPLDIVVLTTYPLAPGILVKVRPIGIAHMIDDGESDAKILAVPEKDPRWDEVIDLADVNQHTLKEIEQKNSPDTMCQGCFLYVRNASHFRLLLYTDAYEKVSPFYSNSRVSLPCLRTGCDCTCANSRRCPINPCAN